MNLNALLALFGRSVRDDTRSKTLLWARLGIAVAVLFSIFRASSLTFFGGATGLSFFSSVVWMNFVVICVAGMSYFASSITEEKEEGTLGLLRMTDLSPVAILLGKGTSRMVGGLLLLLVQLPFAMLAITLGGVRMDQVFGCYALLGAFLFFACNVGLLGSVLTPRTGVASVIACIIGVAYVRSPVFFASIPWPLQAQSEALIGHFSTPSLLSEILQNRGTPIDVGGGCLALLVGGAIAFLAAWLLFDRFCEESAKTASTFGGKSLRRACQALVKSRPSRAWDDAICWRDYYFLHGGLRLARIKFVVYLGAAIWVASTYFDRSSREVLGFFSALFVMASLVAIFESLFATSRIFRLERKEKTLSSLMILPNYYDALLKSKRRAVLVSLIPALFFIAISALVLVGPMLAEAPASFYFWFVQGAGYVVAQLFFNHYLVAWFSLRMKWGGFPLALGISWLGNMMAGFLAVMMFQMGGLLVLIIASTIASITMRNAFRARLEAVATED